MSWVTNVETVLELLKGSSIGEIELSEGEFEIIVRRNPGTLVTITTPHATHNQHMQQNLHTPMPVTNNKTIEMIATLTGIYYASPSPTPDPFVAVGDIITVGQTVALIEAMKVFNEIQAEVSGRVVEIKTQSGNIIKKGDVLFRIEPL
jgi:acetyl-CoA carboxylase biotin carboxyl carrier protein